MYNPRLLPVVLALSMASSSCLFKKPPAAFNPPPPPPYHKRTAVAENIPPPPQLDADPAQAPPPISTTMPDTIEPPKPPAPAPPKRTAPPPRTAQAPPTPEAPPALKLGQILPPEQVRELNKNIDESLDRVKKVLVVVAGRNLNSEQGEIANRIRTFQKQAEQAREQDPVTAVSLAKRADLLAQDLLQRLP